MTDYGRAHGLKLHEIPYTEAARIYKADTKGDFPLSEANFKEAISAEHMVYGSKGIGGPQLAEVNRMLANENTKLKSNFAWLKTQNDHLAAADTSLNKAVAALASGAGVVANR